MTLFTKNKLNKNEILQRRFWLFHHTIGWGEALGQFVYSSDEIDKINHVYRGERAADSNLSNGFYVFDSHTGFQYEWPLMDDDGELLSALPIDMKAGGDLPEQLESTGCIQIDIVAEQNLSSRRRPDVALRRALAKRYYVFSSQPGWLAPGAENIFKTTASLRQAKRIEAEIGALGQNPDIVDTWAIACSH